MTFRLSKRAADDLRGIGSFTKERWGIEQAIQYISDLYSCFLQLGATTGRVYRNRYRYQRIGKHVVFFRVESTARIIIVRVLHERMLPEKHLK